MLDSIIRFSLRYRMLVVVVSLAVLVYGSYLATQMSIDVFPDLDRPRVVIITEAPGLATEEVETLVTQPIEIALMGANGVQAVRSQSTAGLNVIYIEFDWSTEIRAARQTVQERLSTLRRYFARWHSSADDAAVVDHGADRRRGNLSPGRTQRRTSSRKSARPTMMAELVVGDDERFQHSGLAAGRSTRLLDLEESRDRSNFEWLERSRR